MKDNIRKTASIHKFKMCGRTACTLDPDDVCRAYARHYCATGNKTVSWRNDLGEGRYYPCYNIGPAKCAPVVVPATHFDKGARTDEQVILPVCWGLFPFGATSPSERIVNARHETILEKPTFKFPLRSGKRCVILADGYYEWFRGDAKNKQPYFIYFPQPNDVKLHDRSWKLSDAGGEWNGPKPVAMAGIFDTAKADGSLGFVVVTVAASAAVSHIHDRMPALLESEEAVQEWLDVGNVKVEQAVSALRPSTNVSFHTVSPVINSIRNDSVECMAPYVKKDLEQKSKSFMENWLKRKPANTKSIGEDVKKVKIESAD